MNRETGMKRSGIERLSGTLAFSRLAVLAVGLVLAGAEAGVAQWQQTNPTEGTAVSRSGYIGLGVTPSNFSRFEVQQQTYWPSINIRDTGSNPRATLGFGVNANGATQPTQGWVIGQSSDQASRDFYVADNSSGQVRLVITGAGNVGIGTGTPTATFANTSTNILDANNIGVSTGSIAWRMSGQGYSAAFRNNDGTASLRNGVLASIAASDSNSWIFNAESGGANRFSVRADGRVGIGTANPTDKFHVLGDVNNGGVVRLKVENTNPAGFADAFMVNNVGQFAGFQIGGSGVSSAYQFGLPAANMAKFVSNTASYFTIGTTVATPLVFGTADIERLRITPTGNVGIGTLSPVSKFEVPGSQTNSSAKFGSLEIQAYDIGNSWLSDNIYYNGGFKYRADGMGTIAYFNRVASKYAPCPPASPEPLLSPSNV